MLKILLADDNLLTLNQLGEMIKDAEMGAVVVGQAMDGRRAAQLLEDLDPDILITDVDMPLMGGVELAQLVRERGLRTKVIALSNFDSFHFVKPIMKSGAVDYLLKHEMTSGLLRQKIDEVRRQLERDERSARREAVFSLAAKQSFLSGLLMGLPSDAEYRDMMLCQREFQCSQNALIVMQIVNFQVLFHNNSNRDRSQVLRSVTGVCTSVCGTLGNGLVCPMENGEFVLLFHFERMASKQRIYEQAREYASLIVGNLRRLLNLGALMETIAFTDSVLRIRAYYLQARSRLGQQPFPASPPPEAISLEQESRLIEALTAGDGGAVRRLSREILGGEPAQELVCSLIRIGERVRRARGAVCDEAALKAFQNKFRRNLPLQEIRAGVEDYLLSVCAGVRAPRCSEHVQRAIEQIARSYAGELSLETIAEQIGISSVYLSRIFKAETGCSFVDYVNHQRIEAAKRLLLETDCSVREASERVGCPNYSYFIRLFREKTGVTPLRFRRGSQETQEMI